MHVFLFLKPPDPLLQDGSPILWFHEIGACVPTEVLLVRLTCGGLVVGFLGAVVVIVLILVRPR